MRGAGGGGPGRPAAGAFCVSATPGAVRVGVHPSSGGRPRAPPGAAGRPGRPGAARLGPGHVEVDRVSSYVLMYQYTHPTFFGNNFIFFTEREKERVLAPIQVAHAAAVPPAHRLNVTSNARTVEASSPVPPSRYYRARVASRGRGRSRVACAFFALRSRNDNLETDRQNNGLHDTYTLSVCLSLSLLVLLLGWHPTVSTR